MARKDTYAFDSAPDEVDSAARYADDSTDLAPESTEPVAEGPEGESLSLDLFGDKEPAVGDTITLKVTGIDQENGTVTVSLPGGEKTGGIDDAAAAMDEQQT